MEAVPGRFVGAGERRADHHGVGAERDRLGDVPAVAHPAVGDHHRVVAGLEHVRGARVRDVRDRRGLRHPDAEHPARGARRARPHPDEHAGGAGAHQVKARVVGGAAADHHGHVQGGDELLEVERLRDGGDVFAGDDRALDHEHVEARLQRELVVAQHPLGGQRGGDDHLVLP